MSSLPDTPLIPGEDFWSRRANSQQYTFECAPYGIPATITANDEVVLAAARLSAARYSCAPTISSPPIRLRCVVTLQAAAPVPSNLAEKLVYSGVDDWITLSASEWGHGFANLRTREAAIFLSPALAADVRFVSRYFIDHYILNLILTEWAMLHASCVLEARRQRLIVMVAPHNTGKSTTALRLTRAGYTFLADGMGLFKTADGGLIVGGYPIGEVKLRDDVLTLFPEYSGASSQVREHTKTIVDLRAAHPEHVLESVVRPASIHVCCVERNAASETYAAPIELSQAREMVAANTVFWNTADHLRPNTVALNDLLRQASLHRLYVGSDPDSLVVAIDQLR